VLDLDQQHQSHVQGMRFVLLIELDLTEPFTSAVTDWTERA
jgi:hypothetical protein